MLQQIEVEFVMNPSKFLRQKTIAMTLHPNCNALANNYLEKLDDKSYLESLSPETVGTPVQFNKDPRFSPLTIQHLFHINEIERQFDLKIKDFKHISEIGGGYGNMRRVMHGIGFKGRYVIADFPELHKIQQHYFREIDLSESTSFVDISSDKLLPTETPSLLLATFSVNEMPMTDRETLERIYDKFDCLFFAYNLEFDGVNNVGYFSTLQSKLSDLGYKVVVYKDEFKRAWFMAAVAGPRRKYEK